MPRPVEPLISGRDNFSGGKRAESEKHIFDLNNPANQSKVGAVRQLREVADAIIPAMADKRLRRRQ